MPVRPPPLNLTLEKDKLKKRCDFYLAVKRIMQEARELANDPSTDYTAAPLEDDIFVSRYFSFLMIY